MSDETKYSERNAVLRERAAFAAGMLSEFISPIDECELMGSDRLPTTEARVRQRRAELAYPLPKVTP